MSKPPLTPWQKIIRAADNGTGIKLSADEVLRLSQDNAILTRAELDDQEQGRPLLIDDPLEFLGLRRFTREPQD